MGKSTMMCQIAKIWMKQTQTMTARERESMLWFKQVYLIPVRLIHNHTETLERIITHDLKMLGYGREGDVRRQLKFCSVQVLFLVDGYDEMSKKERKNSTINKLLAGEVAPSSTVLVTTRPHCLEYLQQIFATEFPRGLTITSLLELDDYEVRTVLRSRFPDDDPDTLMRQFLEGAPGYIYRIPFFFTVLCDIWIHSKNYTAASSEHHLKE